VAAWAWFGASIAAASLSVSWHGSTLVGLAGSWLLAPGLADSPGLRISDAELTLRCMALAAATCGPLFACLGLAAGAGCSAALRTELPARGRLAALVAALAAAASWALLQGLPPAVLPPRPASTLPPLVSVAAALLAAILMPAARPVADSAPQGATPRRRRNGSASKLKPWVGLPWQRQAAVLLGPVALVLLAQLQAHRHGSAAAPRQLEGGRYHVLWQTELAAGGQLSVIEGVYREQYRWECGIVYCVLAVSSCGLPVHVPACGTEGAHLTAAPLSVARLCCMQLSCFSASVQCGTAAFDALRYRSLQVPPAAPGPQRTGWRVRCAC
jgi:hypothetical protein